MKTLHKKALSAAAVALLSGMACSAAFAADTPTDPEDAGSPIAANVTVVSDYRYRGISQSNFKPAIQGGFDYAHESGFYIGNWNSNISWLSDGYGTSPAVSAPIEMDIYAGYKTEVSGVGVDVGVITYNYPGSTSHGVNWLANTQEAYVGLTYGPATFKTSYVLGKHYFASTADANASAKGTLYYDLTLAQEIAPKLTASAHAGYTDYKESAALYASTGKFSYADYNVGLTYDYEGFLLGAKYYFNSTKAGTKAYADGSGVGEKSNLYKNTLVFSVLKAF